MKFIIAKISLVLFFSILLFGGFPGIVKETVISVSAQAAGKVYAARITVVIPMATCVNPYTSSACTNCNQGAWDDITVSPSFGGDTSVQSNTYACKMATFMQQGTGMCQMGEVIFGPAMSQQLIVNDFQQTNIWCQMQM